MKAKTMEAVIGVEVHAQLLTRSKLFCSCSTAFGDRPNSNTCPICTGHPGTLPVINGRAHEMAASMALACGCRVNSSSRFARKHYLYPGLPKGYQIILCIALLFGLIQPAAAQTRPATPEQLGRTPGYFIARTTPHFHLYAPTRYKAALEALASQAEPVLAKISGDMSITPRGPVRVMILTTDKDVDQLTFSLPPTPEWSVGYAVAGRKIIVLKTAFLRGTVHQDVLSTFRHELVHILVRDATGPYAALVPRWFNEGLAMIHTRAWGLGDVVNLSKHLITSKPLPLGELTRGFPQSRSSAGVAYAQSYLFLTHLRKNHGRDAPGKILRRVGTGMAFNQAFHEVTGRALHRVEAEWRRGLTWRYRYIPMVTSGGTLWLGVTLLFILGYYRKWKRNRELLEQWEDEEEGRGW